MTDESKDAWQTVPKHEALKRLGAEGREEKFRERQRAIRAKDRKITRTDAFYLALKEFPPLT